MSDVEQPLHRSVRGRSILAAVLAGMGFTSTVMAIVVAAFPFKLGMDGGYDCDSLDAMTEFALMGLALLVPATLVAVWTLIRVVREQDRTWGRWLALVVLLVSIVGIPLNLSRLQEVRQELDRHENTGSPCP